MRIGDAAAAAGTTPRALRFYEQRGLLAPQGRSPSGQREYGPGDVARIRIIRDLLAHGFTVEDLRGVADRLHLLTADPPPSCGSAGGVVGHRLSVLDAEIDRLTRLREALAHRAGLPGSTAPPKAVPERPTVTAPAAAPGPDPAAVPVPDSAPVPVPVPAPVPVPDPDPVPLPVPNPVPGLGTGGGRGRAGRPVGVGRGSGGPRAHTLDRS